MSYAFFAYLDSLGFWANTIWQSRPIGLDISIPNFPSGTLGSTSIEKAINFIESTSFSSPHDISPQAHVRFLNDDADISSLNIVNVGVDLNSGSYDPFNT